MWHLLPYLGLCLLITFTPGLDTAVVTRSVLARGSRAGVGTALGCALGLYVHATAVALGLAVLLARSAPAFEAVRLAGAAFLVLLGLRSLWASRPSPAEPAGSSTPGRRSIVERAGRAALGGPFLQGLLTNLTNPKAALFFLATLPPFLPVDRPQAALPIALGLATIAAGLSLTVLSLYATGLGRVRSRLLGARFRRLQERLLGTVLIGLGLKVAFES
jgi:threonine/homoserine/homoserine lactone efflux protein